MTGRPMNGGERETEIRPAAEKGIKESSDGYNRDLQDWEGIVSYFAFHLNTTTDSVRLKEDAFCPATRHAIQVNIVLLPCARRNFYI